LGFQTTLLGHSRHTFLREIPDTKTKSPHKAGVLAATLPGAGQIYNQKYWKLPIVYAGFGLLSYSIVSNNRNFNAMQNELTARSQNDSSKMNPNFARFPVAYLRSERNYYRSNRDLSIVGLFAFYALSILDATVDAHLYQFDVNKSLSLNAKPAPVWTANGFQSGVNLGLRLQF
jgi:hypothetical protein